jgi:hypothetical protein
MLAIGSPRFYVICFSDEGGKPVILRLLGTAAFLTFDTVVH